MTTLKPSFSKYPTDVLYTILLKLPFNEIMNLCKTQYSVKDICNNPTFWADKTRLDFGVSNPVFYQKLQESKIHPAEVYASYLEVYMMTKFLTKVFELGMLFKGWKGPGYAYSDRLPYPNISEESMPKYIFEIKNIVNDSPLEINKLINSLFVYLVYSPPSENTVNEIGEEVLGFNTLLQTKKLKPRFSSVQINNKTLIYQPNPHGVRLMTYIQNIADIKEQRLSTGYMLITNAFVYLAKYKRTIPGVESFPFSWYRSFEDSFFDMK